MDQCPRGHLATKEHQRFIPTIEALITHAQIDVERVQLLHLGLGKVKIIALQIRHQALVIVALGNHGKALLSRPTEKNLCRRYTKR